MRGRWLLHFVWLIGLGLGQARAADGDGMIVVTWPPPLSDETRGVIQFEIGGGTPYESVRCTVDGGYAEDCSSGELTYSGLENGVHRLDIEALNLAGDVVQTAGFDWAVERLRDPNLSPSEQDLADFGDPFITDSRMAYFVSAVEDDDSCYEAQAVPVQLDGSIACPADTTCAVLRVCMYPLGEKWVGTYKYYPGGISTQWQDPADFTRSTTVEWESIGTANVSKERFTTRVSPGDREFATVAWEQYFGDVRDVSWNGSISDPSLLVDMTLPEVAGLQAAIDRTDLSGLTALAPQYAYEEMPVCWREANLAIAKCYEKINRECEYSAYGCNYDIEVKECKRIKEDAQKRCPGKVEKCGKYVMLRRFGDDGGCGWCSYETTTFDKWGTATSVNKTIRIPADKMCPQKCNVGIVMLGKGPAQPPLVPTEFGSDGTLKCLTCPGLWHPGEYPIIITQIIGSNYYCCDPRKPENNGGFCHR